MGGSWQVGGRGIERFTGTGDPAVTVVPMETEGAPGALPGLGAVERDVLGQLRYASVPFMERSGRRAAGVVVVPSATGSRRAASRFGFVLSPDRLLLVEAGSVCDDSLEALAADGAGADGVAGVLWAVIRHLLRDHSKTLSRVRDELEVLEEDVLEGTGRPDRRLMMSNTRALLGLDACYQGLSDIVGALAEEGEGLVATRDRTRFERLARQIDRLQTRLEALQDYGIQVHGLYQEGIDLRQNSVMQWLTVVATIAMPLTFVTSWYGMNFRNMLLINTSWGYLVAVGLCVAIAAGEIAFFHRRGWLSFKGAEAPRRSGRPGSKREGAR